MDMGEWVCIVLCRTCHTAPEQGQGPPPIVPNCSGSGPGPCAGTGHSQYDYTTRAADQRKSKRIPLFALELVIFRVKLVI